MAALVVLALSTLVLEGASYAVAASAPRLIGISIRRRPAMYRDHAARARELAAADAAGRDQIDSLLGWRYRAGFARDGDVVNAQGLRSHGTYAPVPAPDVVRIAAFGDSFVYGSEVATADAWPTLAEQAGAPALEVLNFGVGGYGVDQAYLRFQQEAHAWAPHVVVMGFTPDDLRRLVNVYRPFIDDRELPLAKPRFVLDSAGALRLVPAPLRHRDDYARLADHPESSRDFAAADQWYAPVIYANPLYDVSATARVLSVLATRVHRKYLGRDRLLDGALFHTGSTAFRLQVALFERFVADVRASGAQPLLLMLPDLHAIERALDGQPAAYAPLVDALAARGLPVLDARSAFTSQPGARAAVDGWFMPGGHYSRAGNAVVACLVWSHVGTPGRRPDVPPASCVDRVLGQPGVRGAVSQHHERAEDGGETQAD